MSRTECIKKVVRATQNGIGKPGGISGLPLPFRKARTVTPDPVKIIYQATAGQEAIHPYVLERITQVCNTYQSTSNPAMAYQLLDKPLQKVDALDNTESEKGRLMRLQLRHRLVAATASGMSLVEFCQKLLTIWGGSLLDVSQSHGNQTPESMDKAFPARNEFTVVGDVPLCLAGATCIQPTPIRPKVRVCESLAQL
jgi:hypothetical protein